jgi:hypothetical protein
MDYSPSVNLRVSHAILFLLSPTYTIFFLEGSEVLGQSIGIGDTSLYPTVSSRATTTHLIFRLFLIVSESRPKGRGFYPIF